MHTAQTVSFVDMLEGLDVIEIHGRTDVEIRGITLDSRQVRAGYLFAAVKGTTADGMNFVDDAVSRGATVVVTAPTRRRFEACHVQVADPAMALARLAAAFHGHPDRQLRVFGITGTNGKTTTSFLLRSILGQAGCEPGMIGTVGYFIGDRAIPASRTTPDAPALFSLMAGMVRHGCRAVVLEVSSHALAQRRVGALKVDVAAFTNLTRDHLDYHGRTEDYFLAKSRLFDLLVPEGHAVINVDDLWGVKLVETMAATRRCVRYGIGAGDVQARGIRHADDGSLFQLESPWGAAEIHLALYGPYNVSNALAAAAAALAVGTPLAQVQEGLAAMRQVPGRLQAVTNHRGIQAFVDYAHTDDALKLMLQGVRAITRGRLIVVFGCGGDRDAGKRALMGQMAVQYADRVFITSDNPRSERPEAIAEDILEGIRALGVAEPRVNLDRAACIHEAVRAARPGDTLVVAGKGHETFQQFADRTVPFDDRQVLTEALENG